MSSLHLLPSPASSLYFFPPENPIALPLHTRSNYTPFPPLQTPPHTQENKQIIRSVEIINDYTIISYYRLFSFSSPLVPLFFSLFLSSYFLSSFLSHYPSCLSLSPHPYYPFLSLSISLSLSFSKKQFIDSFPEYFQ